MSYQKERESFIARIVSESCNVGGNIRTATALARGILRDAATHNRIAEAECSIEMSEREAARVARQSEACERRIVARLAELGPGFSVAEFSGDPRGATVKIRVPSGYGDSWGDRSHYCVPVRS